MQLDLNAHHLMIHDAELASSSAACSGVPASTLIGQAPQHGRLFGVDQRTQPCHPGADQRNGMRGGGLRLAALSVTNTQADSLHRLLDLR
jgi:hypothetical protein